MCYSGYNNAKLYKTISATNRKVASSNPAGVIGIFH